jgi:hypothetical protein
VGEVEVGGGAISVFDPSACLLLFLHEGNAKMIMKMSENAIIHPMTGLNDDFLLDFIFLLC